MHRKITALQQMLGNTVGKFPGPENVPGLAQGDGGHVLLFKLVSQVAGLPSVLLVVNTRTIQLECTWTAHLGLVFEWTHK